MKTSRRILPTCGAAFALALSLGCNLSAGDLQLMAGTTTEAIRWNASVQKSTEGADYQDVDLARQKMLDRAVLWRRFQSDFPRSARVREAKRQEAISLLRAGWAGDDSAAARRAELTISIRSDSAITDADRFEVAAYAERLDLVRTDGLSKGQRIAKEEEIARKLAAEFPTVPAAHESLLGIARCSGDEHAIVLLVDLLKSAAPDALKLEATRLLKRYDLLGTALIDQLQAVAGAEKIKRGENEVIVFYVWSQKDLGSRETAKEAASIQLPGLRLIGLEVDVPEIAEGSDRSAPPGEQLELSTEQVALLRQRLRLEDVPLVYVTDRSGRIHSVSAQNNISAAVIAASLP